MNSKWVNLIATAERLVGGPAPFINLDHLLTSEAAFLAARAKRLASTVDHPFFDSVRAYLHGKSTKNTFLPLRSRSTQGPIFSTNRAPGGLVTLLVGQCGAGASAGGVNLSGTHRRVAEIFETVNLAIVIHKSLVNVKQLSRRHPINQRLLTSCVVDSSVVKSLEAGNKVATLAGDMLFSSVSKSLATFHNCKVVSLVSEAMGNMLEAEFSSLAMRFHYGLESTNNISDGETSALSHDQSTLQWLDYVGLARGSLLGACCQSTILLSQAAVTSTLDSANSNTNLESVSGVTYQLGRQWALLVRLLDERDYMRRFHFRSGNSTSDCDQYDPTIPASPYVDLPYYVENGLPEPTLIDALTAPTGESDHRCTVRLEPEEMWRHYNSVGLRLVHELRDSLHDLGLATSMLGSPTKSSSSALALLTCMVDELDAELDCQLPDLS